MPCVKRHEPPEEDVRMIRVKQKDANTIVSTGQKIKKARSLQSGVERAT
jgi:hypothetical protein